MSTWMIWIVVVSGWLLFAHLNVRGGIKAYLKNNVLWLDQGINVIPAPLWNLFVKKDTPHRFGDPDEYPSSVFGKNVEHGGCTVCVLMCMFLSLFDDRHCEKSREPDEGKDAL